MLRVLGLLAALTAAFEVLMVVTVGPMYRYHLTWSAMLGQELGGWLALFLASAISAGIAALLTRKRQRNYPGLGTGATIAVAFAGAAWIGRCGMACVNTVN